MRILSLDPGERVGWARADVADDGTWTDLRHGITPLKDMAVAVAQRQLLDQLEDGSGASTREYDLIVCEDWRLHPGKEKRFIGSGFPSVQFIGMVRLCCWLSGTKLVLQQPSDKTTADKTLARLWPEMYAKVTQSGSHDDLHDMDAIRHLWFWTFRNTNVALNTLTKEAA